MPSVLFVDTDPKVAEEWENSPHRGLYSACPFTPFTTITETARQITEARPDIVVFRRILGSLRGQYVSIEVRKLYDFGWRSIINGPSGSNKDTPCTPGELRKVLDNCITIAQFRTSYPAPASQPPKFAQANKPAVPALAESPISPDGYVKCPHYWGGRKCLGERYVGVPGRCTCYTCDQAFMAVAPKKEGPPPVVASALKKAAIASDGWVQCPDGRCGTWKNVQNKHGVYACDGCDEKFEAVAAETAPAPGLEEAVIESDGWVQCPNSMCSRYLDVNHKSGQYNCERCGQDFMAVTR